MGMFMIYEHQIALIFTQYNAPGQPYLTNWVASLRPQGFSLNIFSNNKVATCETPESVFEIDAPPGKLDAAKYFARRWAPESVAFFKMVFSRTRFFDQR